MLLPYLRLEVKFTLTRTSTPNRIPRGPSWWVDAGSLPQHDICYKMKISKTYKYPFIPMASHGFPRQKIMGWRFGISMHIICISPIFVDAKMGSIFSSPAAAQDAPVLLQNSLFQLMPSRTRLGEPAAGSANRKTEKMACRKSMPTKSSQVQGPAQLTSNFITCHIMTIPKKNRETTPSNPTKHIHQVLETYIYMHISIFTIQCSFHNSNSTHSTVAFNGKPW